MSVETIAIVISAATLMLGFFGAFGWMILRTDAQLGALETGLEARLEARLGARIDRVEHEIGRVWTSLDRVDQRLGRVEQELVEVKIAVARIEGPPRRLLTER